MKQHKETTNSYSVEYDFFDRVVDIAKQHKETTNYQSLLAEPHQVSGLSPKKQHKETTKLCCCSVCIAYLLRRSQKKQHKETTNFGLLWFWLVV
jgi:hypothetical protein